MREGADRLLLDLRQRRVKKKYSKASLYLPGTMVQEITSEAQRLGKPISWVVQQCIARTLPKLKGYPSPDDISLVPSEGRDERK